MYGKSCVQRDCGNIKGVTKLQDPEGMCKQEKNAAVTRAAMKKGKRPFRKLSVPDLKESLNMDVKKMHEARQWHGVC